MGPVSVQPPRGDLATVWGRWARRDGGETQDGLADQGGASLRGVRLAGWRVSCRAPSGWEWNRPCQGASELGFCRVRRRAERVSRPAMPCRPDRSALSSRLPHRQPGAVGGEAARRKMIQPHAVLQVSNGVLDLGMAAVVGLQLQGFPVPVGDEARQLGTGRRRTMSVPAASGRKGVQVVSRRRRPSSMGWASSPPRVSRLDGRLLCWRMVIDGLPAVGLQLMARRCRRRWPTAPAAGIAVVACALLESEVSQMVESRW